MREFKTKNGYSFRPNFKKFKRVVSADQLRAGMVLIDKRMHKRTILSISDGYIWLGHKFNKAPAQVTGKEYQIDNFINNYPNWIFSE